MKGGTAGGEKFKAVVKMNARGYNIRSECMCRPKVYKAVENLVEWNDKVLVWGLHHIIFFVHPDTHTYRAFI